MKDERFSAVKKRLEDAGWYLDRVNGSHHVFKKTGRSTISIPVHGGKVKGYYVNDVERILQEEEEADGKA